ncbi:hypothetical protein E2C01_057037 [Portunus trituberculatus]|uniref:Uncharacterized protein n=1 Tax=Portunus trituberculatus TaxID=210409 RepID=A0A5B7GZA0_PORTR|nr:hypothetical protein [Portunus trituberculatus]
MIFPRLRKDGKSPVCQIILHTFNKSCSPQPGGREGEIIGLPSRGRKIYAERFHSLAVTCAQGCRILPGNTGKVLREEVGDNLRVCHRSPSQQQNRWGGTEYFPAIRRTLLKASVRGVRALMEDTYAFQEALCASFKTRRARAQQRRKASRHCVSPRCRRRREKADRFSFTALVHAAFHQGTGPLVKRPDVLRIV